MQLVYICGDCHAHIVIHTGDMSRINFGRMPTTVYEASQHRCSKKKKEAA